VWFPADVVERWVPASGADSGGFARFLILQWVQVAERFGALPGAQHVTPIWDVIGWNQYVSKHAARGLNHYQRNPAHIPPGWREIGTGRMWGYLSTRADQWPLVDPCVLDVNARAFWFVRRVVRGYRLADAREALRRARDEPQARAARRRIVQARGMLRADTVELSSVRGLSEWLPQDAMFRVVALVSESGGEIAA
jgi:hypothetical protein